MSGFRTENTLELEITTDYADVYEGVEEYDERHVLLPVHEIVNAQPFDIDVYDKLTADSSR